MMEPTTFPATFPMIYFINNINVPNLLGLENKVVKDAVEDLEAQISNAYQPVQNEEPKSESELVPPPCITYIEALQVLDTLILYNLQTGTMD